MTRQILNTASVFTLCLLGGFAFSAEEKPEGQVLPRVGVMVGSDYSPTHFGVSVGAETIYGEFIVGAGLSGRSNSFGSDHSSPSLGSPLFFKYVGFNGMTSLSLSYMSGNGDVDLVYQNKEDPTSFPGFECFFKSCSSQSGTLRKEAKWSLVYLHLGMMIPFYEKDRLRILGEMGFAANMYRDFSIKGDKAAGELGRPVGIKVDASSRFAGEGDRGVYGLINLDYKI